MMGQKQSASQPESKGPSLSDHLSHLDREKFARNMVMVAGQSQKLIGEFLRRWADRDSWAIRGSLNCPIR